MPFYIKTDTNTLSHHGILGMKWGKLNGPPYPLGSSDHSAKEKSKGTKGWTKEAKQENKSSKSSKSSNSKSVTEPSTKKSGLSDKQKTALKIGAAVAVTALAAYGGVKLAQSGALNNYIKTGQSATATKLIKDVSTAKVSDIEGFTMLDAKQAAIENAIKDANPLFTKGNSKQAILYDNNCVNTVIATDMRARGYDVIARGMNIGGRNNMQSIATAYTGLNSDTFRKIEVDSANYKSTSLGTTERGKAMYNSYTNSLKGYPPGARGTMSVQASVNSKIFNHAIGWRITDDGKPELFDSQKGFVYTSDNPLFTYGAYSETNSLNSGGVANANIARLDNLKVNKDGIKDFVTSANDMSVNEARRTSIKSADGNKYGFVVDIKN